MGSIKELTIDNGTLWKRILESGEDRAKTSSCVRKGVCASIYHITSQKILFTCINGSIPFEDKDSLLCTGEIGNCGCVHAEMIASSWLLSNPRIDNVVLVCSFSPCKTCANMILISDRILSVVYLHETENYKDGKDILRRNSVPCLSIDECDFHDQSTN